MYTIFFRETLFGLVPKLKDLRTTQVGSTKFNPQMIFSINPFMPGDLLLLEKCWPDL